MPAAQSIPRDVDVFHERDRMILRGQAGRATLEFPSPRVVRITYEGVGYEAFVPIITREIEARCELPVVLAVDAFELGSYETGYRKLWTDWMHANKPKAILILFRSRLVAMGIALANAILGGGIRGFVDREAFEQAVRDAARADLT